MTLETVEKLAGVLEAQTAVLKKLIAVAEEEMEALVSGDAGGVLRAAAEQEKLTAAIAGLENERCAVQQLLEEELALPRNGKLAELLHSLPVKYNRVLEALTERLAGDVLELLRLQSRICFLLQRGLMLEEAVARTLCREDYAGAGSRYGLVDRSV
jgi:flagellar biosynthesis/type III secretory pathway chaperone